MRENHSLTLDFSGGTGVLMGSADQGLETL